MRHRRSIAAFIVVIQSFLFLAHFFLYKTWTFGQSGSYPSEHLWLAVVLGVLSISFVVASVLAFSHTNAPLRALYRAAAVWMGLLSFLFIAAVFAWILFAASALTGAHMNFHAVVQVLFAAGVIVGSFGLFNASWTRITRIRVRLENLPDAWRGRTAALVSDVHLGHVRNGNFLRRLIAKILREEPDLIFIAGDLFDGTAIDAARAAAPLSMLTAPHGVYFVAGNHEQFGDDSKYLNAVAATGVRVLHNERVNVDGLQVVGVPYRNATSSGDLACYPRMLLE